MSFHLAHDYIVHSGAEKAIQGQYLDAVYMLLCLWSALTGRRIPLLRAASQCPECLAFGIDCTNPAFRVTSPQDDDQSKEVGQIPNGHFSPWTA